MNRDNFICNIRNCNKTYKHKSSLFRHQKKHSENTINQNTELYHPILFKINKRNNKKRENYQLKGIYLF